MHLEAILGLLVTNGMARSAPNVSAITTLADPKGKWWKSFMPRDNAAFGPGGSPYLVSEDEKARYYRMEMQAWVFGFAFADNSLTMRAAMAVFYCYVVFVLAFSAWSIWTGFTSSSWESIPDLLTLSMNEKARARRGAAQDPESLEELYFMQDNYCIAVNGDRLTLRAADGTVPEDLRVKPNKSYE
ncbi:hypothetical protein EDB81DRAFT_886786 [Dactylonectria macrodidyma]|uniref:Uncharacterized protein n=1 Tax=Dactylonectria macrodidyma TaxID=307937 RepID=A0A9P9E9R4_9HYPO|nr:hypothetical protein EDB81DRAFT_886786 [Dactylonectria macrodidyma]